MAELKEYDVSFKIAGVKGWEPHSLKVHIPDDQPPEEAAEKFIEQAYENDIVSLVSVEPAEKKKREVTFQEMARYYADHLTPRDTWLPSFGNIPIDYLGPPIDFNITARNTTLWLGFLYGGREAYNRVSFNHDVAGHDPIQRIRMPFDANLDRLVIFDREYQGNALLALPWHGPTSRVRQGETIGIDLSRLRW